jgi:crotonobetainyl-CoA:carnitine CoA-transferase CaiB-like acyl-CoA transferase
LVSARPLAGLKVLEFSLRVMGPTAGLLFAELGADVVKGSQRPAVIIPESWAGCSPRLEEVTASPRRGRRPDMDDDRAKADQHPIRQARS